MPEKTTVKLYRYRETFRKPAQAVAVFQRYRQFKPMIMCEGENLVVRVPAGVRPLGVLNALALFDAHVTCPGWELEEMDARSTVRSLEAS